MNTTKQRKFDYHAYIKENSPELKKIYRGSEARELRFEAAKKGVSIHIDEDIVEQFRKIAPREREYESLINQSLREWLSAKIYKKCKNRKLNDTVSTIPKNQNRKGNCLNRW